MRSSEGQSQGRPSGGTDSVRGLRDSKELSPLPSSSTYHQGKDMHMESQIAVHASDARSMRSGLADEL
jgi:hypothetical protein